jgi:hypothetical protein
MGPKKKITPKIAAGATPRRANLKSRMLVRRLTKIPIIFLDLRKT